MQIDHVHFYVKDAKDKRDWFVNVMGLSAIALKISSHTHTEVVSNGNNQVKFFLSSPLNTSSPVAQFLSLHSEGVADIAFTVDDLKSVVDKVIANGGKLTQPIQQSTFKWCQIVGEAGLNHTLIEKDDSRESIFLPSFTGEDNWVKYPLINNPKMRFTNIDHLVLNVGVGDLERVANWYEKALGFLKQQTFTIKTERSALYSQVMVHSLSGLQFPINEPLSPNSQVQEFLDYHKGAGIQHIALTTPNIAQVTQKLRQTGLSFLKVPETYYNELQKNYQKLGLSIQEWQELITQEILIDYQENNEIIKPLLLQVFTQPILEKPTFFFELIERRFQAKGFGKGNFRALFAGIEQEQIKRGFI